MTTLADDSLGDWQCKMEVIGNDIIRIYKVDFEACVCPSSEEDDDDASCFSCQVKKSRSESEVVDRHNDIVGLSYKIKSDLN